LRRSSKLKETVSAAACYAAAAEPSSRSEKNNSGFSDTQMRQALENSALEQVRPAVQAVIQVPVELFQDTVK
jgi:hypothetical protein